MSVVPLEPSDRQPNLNEEQRRAVLSLVRQAVEDFVRQGERPGAPRLPFLSAAVGVFVTILHGDQLRGCIGIAGASRPLGEALLHCAIAAASEDRRFPPVTAEELPYLRYEVSILSPLREVTSPDAVEPGRHGVMIESGERRGLLLPQVADSHGWDREELLSQVCRKAGLPPQAWTGGVRIWVFEADVFAETAC